MHSYRLFQENLHKTQERPLLKYFKILLNILLLLAIPSTVYPRSHAPHPSYQNRDHFLAKISFSLFSYDEVLQLLKELESGELEKKYTDEQTEQIVHFLALLAKKGELPDLSAENLSLDADIACLLYGRDNLDEYSSSLIFSEEDQYIIPAVFYGNDEILLCKSWMHKRWKHIKKFAKKHKKALIIGAAVVVAATVIVASLAASASAAAAAAGAATAPDPSPSDSKSKESSEQTETLSEISPLEDAPSLLSIINEQTASFKETIVENQFFQEECPSVEIPEISWEETARILTSLWAHDSSNNLQNESLRHPELTQELREIQSNYDFLIPHGYQEPSTSHWQIDNKFSTEYSSLYSNPNQEVDFYTISHQALGEKALKCGYYDQAIQNLGKAIEANPTNPIPYLKRGIAYFELGEYDRSLEDYKHFTVQTNKDPPLSVSEFSFGIAQGLPKGIYESGESILLFMTDFIQHPIHASEQIVDSITTLVNLARSDEWEVIAEALSPEMHQLVTQWDALSSEQRGELAGYAIGKHGADILIPGTLAKAFSNGAKSVQELIAIHKNLQMARDTLILETVTGIGNPTKIAEVVETGQKTIQLADELGFTAQEMGQLKKTGHLEEIVNHTLKDIFKDPALQQSYKLFESAECFLEPHRKNFMPESQIRDLIHQTGIRTFPRPAGIPENFRVRLSDGGAGMLYVHPEHTHISIRVMPGKPHSPNPNQQTPYVIYMKNGKALDKHGNIVNKKAPEAHIPLDEFTYRD